MGAELSTAFRKCSSSLSLEARAPARIRHRGPTVTERTPRSRPKPRSVHARFDGLIALFVDELVEQMLIEMRQDAVAKLRANVAATRDCGEACSRLPAENPFK